MFKKFAALAAAAALSLGVMTGCGASGTTADSTGYSAENPLVLTLAHGLSETHTVHIAMTQFADEVAEKTDGRIQVKIFPNGQLGSENENLEQLQAGVIAMTKVSAPGLATYNDAFNTFGLPYIFNDTDDFYHVMDSQEMQDFFLSTGDDGFVTLTYYTSGARSFYTKDRAIRTPADLKGLKIRVQDMKSQTDMMSYLGGIPVAMSYGDVYTSLLTLDRSCAGSRADIVHTRSCKVRSQNGALKLRILLDKNSVEVFVNDGEQTMTAWIYTPQSADGITFAADGQATITVEQFELNL